MKAWQFDDNEGYSIIIYAETRNQARVKVLRAIEHGDLPKYKDIRVIRAAWADKYGEDFEIIPLVALLKMTGGTV